MSATPKQESDGENQEHSDPYNPEEDDSDDEALCLADIEALKAETIKSIIEDRSIMYKRQTIHEIMAGSSGNDRELILEKSKDNQDSF